MLLAQVSAHLATNVTPHAVIGAAALAAHGVSRATSDIDLLTVDARVLNQDYWKALSSVGIGIEIRHGDDDDPLRGIAQIRATSGEVVEVIVFRDNWQREIPERATPVQYDGSTIPLARRSDLILLKLYAGGLQDQADIERLLVLSSVTDVQEIDARVGELPEWCRELWSKLRPG